MKQFFTKPDLGWKNDTTKRPCLKQKTALKYQDIKKAQKALKWDPWWALGHVPDDALRAAMYLEPSCCEYDNIAKHLYCNLPWFNSTVRVRSWSEGCYVEMEKNGGWIAKYDKFLLPLLSDFLTGKDSKHPIARYTHELPQNIVRRIAPFADSQLAMLQICAASKRGEQLLQNSPVLFWLIAPEMLRRAEGKPETIHTMLGLRQRELLALLCGRSKKSFINLLAKLPAPEALHMPKKELFAILAKDEAISLFRHKACIDWLLLVLVAELGDKINIPLVRSIIMSDMNTIARQETVDNLDRIVADTIKLGQQVGLADAASIVSASIDWQRLWGLHETWRKRLRQMELDAIRYNDDKLPPPPLSGMDGIQPIDSKQELWREGHIMHHCVGICIDDVLSGECYIYRITEPERATLEICPNGNGTWSIGQLKSYCNRTPGVAVFRHVQKWLAEKNNDHLKETITMRTAYFQFNLGNMYYHGLGVEQDDTNAVQWYEKAATQGHFTKSIDIKTTKISLQD